MRNILVAHLHAGGVGMGELVSEAVKCLDNVSKAL